jgi:hypothetical protein
MDTRARKATSFMRTLMYHHSVTTPDVGLLVCSARALFCHRRFGSSIADPMCFAHESFQPFLDSSYEPHVRLRAGQ